MKSKPTIGILAGMGPRATAPFVDLVIDRCQELYAAKYDLDFPHLLIYSLPTPFYVGGELDHEKVKDTICAGLKKLESCGVSFIAMPCNSAHAYFDDLLTQIDVPLLNMISEAVSALRLMSRGRRRRVAILAAEMTIEAGLYQKALCAPDSAGSIGAEVIDNSLWQERVNELIVAAKNFAAPDDLQKRWSELNKTLIEEKIDTMILACTDLNALDLTRDSAAPILDAGACLAEAAVRRWRKLEQTQDSSN